MREAANTLAIDRRNQFFLPLEVSERFWCTHFKTSPVRLIVFNMYIYIYRLLGNCFWPAEMRGFWWGCSDWQGVRYIHYEYIYIHIEWDRIAQTHHEWLVWPGGLFFFFAYLFASFLLLLMDFIINPFKSMLCRSTLPYFHAFLFTCIQGYAGRCLEKDAASHSSEPEANQSRFLFQEIWLLCLRVDVTWFPLPKCSRSHLRKYCHTKTLSSQVTDSKFSV